jgi:hypothetical protein
MLDVQELLKTAKPIDGYESYFATQCGNVISTKGKTVRKLKAFVDGAGYLAVWLRTRGETHRKKVHQLIATVFHGPKPNEHSVVRHLDNERLNNAPSNLRWGSRIENEADKIRHGTQICGAQSHFARLTENEVRVMRKLRAMGVTTQRISEIFGITQGYASVVCRKKKWKAVV